MGLGHFLLALGLPLSIGHQLPSGPIIAGYQNWNTCNVTQSVTAARQGVNLIYWFALNLLKDANGQPAIEAGPDPQCVADTRAALEAENLPTTHLISIGGWDAPHPDTSFSGEEWFQVWHRWNQALPQPYEGFDWDLEGCDDASSPNNNFTAALLHLVIDMSVAARAAGYIVTVVPAQSYLDASTSGFNLSLLNFYPDWHPDFKYHGLNTYAYLLAAAPADTFALVTVQLYETWSRADQLLLQKEIPGARALQLTVEPYLNGWTVDFGHDPALRISGPKVIQISTAALLIGLSWGSSSGNSAFFFPKAVQASWESAPAAMQPRGYAFWNIQADGTAANGTNITVNLATGLNAFLHTRPAMAEIIV